MENENIGRSLSKSKDNKLVAGICGGIGEYLDFDPQIVRIAFILLGLMFGIGIIIYVILWIGIPEKGNVSAIPGFRSGDPVKMIIAIIGYMIIISIILLVLFVILYIILGIVMMMPYM